MDDDCQVLVEDDDDDPLIAEVDIYLTRIFADQLYLFQYPLRTNNLQFENNSTLIGARLKPKNKLVQLDYVLDTQSKFHCKKNEKNIIQNLTTTNEKIQSIDRLTLSSNNLTLGDNYKRFAVGILTSNGIQLSPLNAIFQLRPDFDATTSILAQPIDDDEIENESKHTDDTTTDEETNEKPSNELVTMKFWRPEGRLQREKKLRSYNYFERARHEERWIDFAYYSPSELQSIELRNQWIMKDNIERNRLPIRWRKTLSIHDYYQLLFFDKQILLENLIDKDKITIESNITTEQKPLIVPPTKPKKKKKSDLEKKQQQRKLRKKIEV